MALLRLTGRGTDLPASKQFHEKRKTKKKEKKNSNGRFNCRELYTSWLF